MNLQIKIPHLLALSEKYLKEENWAQTLIMKQLTEIKTTVKPTNTLVTCNANSIDKPT